MTTQLTFGLMSGETKVDPYAVGDIVVRHGERFAIKALEPEAYGKPALILVSLRDGREAIKFQHEIDYRSR